MRLVSDRATPIFRAAPRRYGATMPESTLSTIERAIEIAKAGSARSIPDIRRQLRSEGFSMVEANTTGSAVQKQLRALIDIAHG